MSLQVITDVSLLEYYESKIKKCILRQKGQIISVKNYFPEDPSYQKISKFPFTGDISFNITGCLINTILSFGKGHASLCGINTVHWMCGEFITKLDLYYDSYTKEEIMIIFNECVKCCNLTILEQGESYATLAYDSKTLVFHFTPFEDKASILHSLGDSSEMHGWNPTTGYFSGVVGCLMISLSPLSLNYQPISMDTYKMLKPTISIGDDLYELFGKVNICKDILQHIVYHYLLLRVDNAKRRLIINY